MFQMKSRFIPAVLTAMAFAALTACGGGDNKPAETTTAAETTAVTETAAETQKEETTEAAAEATEAKAEAGGKDDYLAQVDTMNKAAEEFISASMEFMQLAQDDPENTDGMTECIEKTRATKQAFVDFAAIDNPPEGLAEQHERLVTAAADYADTLDVYCDVLLASINGEDHEAADTIQDDWTKVATELSEAMGEVHEAAAN